jgi:hypothetical protein
MYTQNLIDGFLGFYMIRDICLSLKINKLINKLNLSMYMINLNTASIYNLEPFTFAMLYVRYQTKARSNSHREENHVCFQSQMCSTGKSWRSPVFFFSRQETETQTLRPSMKKLQKQDFPILISGLLISHLVPFDGSLFWDKQKILLARRVRKLNFTEIPLNSKLMV